MRRGTGAAWRGFSAGVMRAYDYCAMRTDRGCRVRKWTAWPKLLSRCRIFLLVKACDAGRDHRPQTGSHGDDFRRGQLNSSMGPVLGQAHRDDLSGADQRHSGLPYSYGVALHAQM